jgi:Spy/CpxP family protein refolding chaperone
MKNRAIIIAVVTAAALAAVAAAALAGGPGHPGAGPWAAGSGGMFAGMHGGRGLGLLGPALQRLDLTTEQRDAIRAVLEAERPALDELRAKVREAQEAFVAAHPPTEFDEAAIRAHHAAMAPLLADVAVAEARARAKALAVLTPEQLAELEAMRAEMRERMQERMHGRRERRECRTAPAGM